jgi:hypothetical protein
MIQEELVVSVVFNIQRKLQNECGGTQRGRCREVKNGNMTVPEDKAVSRTAKKNAKSNANASLIPSMSKKPIDSIHTLPLVNHRGN